MGAHDVEGRRSRKAPSSRSLAPRVTPTARQGTPCGSRSSVGVRRARRPDGERRVEGEHAGPRPPPRGALCAHLTMPDCTPMRSPGSTLSPSSSVPNWIVLRCFCRLAAVSPRAPARHRGRGAAEEVDRGEIRRIRRLEQCQRREGLRVAVVHAHAGGRAGLVEVRVHLKRAGDDVRVGEQLRAHGLHAVVDERHARAHGQGRRVHGLHREAERLPDGRGLVEDGIEAVVRRPERAARGELVEVELIAVRRTVPAIDRAEYIDEGVGRVDRGRGRLRGVAERRESARDPKPHAARGVRRHAVASPS